MEWPTPVFLVVSWQSGVDILFLALALYVALRWARRAQALRIALAIIALHAAALLARHFELLITSWVLEAAAVVALVVLVLAFQSELRYAVLRLDRVSPRWPRATGRVPHVWPQVAEAAFSMARKRVGALIVLVRRDPVRELVRGGIRIGADVSPELLEATFQKDSPLHDGAVIIEAGKLVLANAVLPLTNRIDVDRHYGTRHRAGMGLAERCDALVVVVSEERGTVTIMQDHAIQVAESTAGFATILQFAPAHPQPSLVRRLAGLILADLPFKLATLALAAFIWGISLVAGGTLIRTVSVPVVFSDLPKDMEITQQSATSLEVELQGSAWVMSSLNVAGLTAHFALSHAQPGLMTLRVDPNSIVLPPGITVDRVTPPVVWISLVRRSSSSNTT